MQVTALDFIVDFLEFSSFLGLGVFWFCRQLLKSRNYRSKCQNLRDFNKKLQGLASSVSFVVFFC